MPLNFTLEVPVKLVPVRVTLVPTGPVPGVKLVIVGATEGAVTVTLTVVAGLGQPPLDTATTV